MSFLKDRIEVTGVLADEKNNDVSLRMDFPDHSGKGMGYIEENEQSCQGDVVATVNGVPMHCTLDGVLEAIGIDRDKVCTYCWTGKE